MNYQVSVVKLQSHFFTISVNLLTLNYKETWKDHAGGTDIMSHT
jgi:hypothetical protein